MPLCCRCMRKAAGKECRAARQRPCRCTRCSRFPRERRNGCNAVPRRCRSCTAVPTEAAKKPRGRNGWRRDNGIKPPPVARNDSKARETGFAAHVRHFDDEQACERERRRFGRRRFCPRTGCSRGRSRSGFQQFFRHAARRTAGFYTAAGKRMYQQVSGCGIPQGLYGRGRQRSCGIDRGERAGSRDLPPAG